MTMSKCFCRTVGEVFIMASQIGHPTNEIMSVMLAKSRISVSLDDSHSICSDCFHGKITRKPFPSDSSKCVLPFDRVHLDL